MIIEEDTHRRSVCVKFLGTPCSRMLSTTARTTSRDDEPLADSGNPRLAGSRDAWRHAIERMCSSREQHDVSAVSTPCKCLASKYGRSRLIEGALI